MTPAARIAAYILQDGRIHNNLDICAWFNMPVLLKRVEDTKKAIIGKTGPTPGDVLREWDRAKLIGREGAFYYFRYGYATLLEMYGKAIGVELAPFHPIDLASDIGETDIRSQEAKPPWRGNKKRSERYVDQDYAPDYLPPRRWDN